MNIEFGREICGDISSAQTREWLVTNGKQNRSETIDHSQDRPTWI